VRSVRVLSVLVSVLPQALVQLPSVVETSHRVRSLAVL
jgi:hypothetical protein